MSKHLNMPEPDIRLHRGFPECVLGRAPHTAYRVAILGGLVLLLYVFIIPFVGKVWGDEVKIRSVKRPGEMESPEDKVQQKNIRMTEIEILGEFEKPSTMFVIPQAPYEYLFHDTKIDFTDEILAPLDKQRVEGMQEWRDKQALP